MRALLITSVFLLGPAGGANATPHDLVSTYVRQTLHVLSYQRADTDLNGDGRSEVFIYAKDRDYCGSGGCTLIVLSQHLGQPHSVLRSTVTQLPIRLLDTSTNGWRDIGVTVSGGGITQPYMARLRYDGRRYPSNPTAPPAEPMHNPKGQELIR